MHPIADTTPRGIMPSRTASTVSTAPLGLINAYSSRNLGDAAIMTAIANMAPSGHAVVALAEKRPLPLKRVGFRGALEDCEHFVSVGGDIFNNARPRLVTRSFLANVGELARHRRNAIVFGQTLPASCRGPSLALLASVLRRTRAVVVRDRESHRILRSRGVEAELSFDAAFALAPQVEDIRAAAAWLEAQGLMPTKLALLSVRPFDALYPQDSERFVARMARLAGMLADRGLQVGVLIQAAVGESDGDHEIAARIVAAEPRTRVVDCLADEGTAHDPVGRLMGVMALAEIVVAVRYHAAVLRLAAGRMPYHMPYSRKGADLTARLDLPGASVKALDPVAQIDDIVATAAMAFDPRPLEADVRARFHSALSRLS